jgi:hypothetical protein
MDGNRYYGNKKGNCIECVIVSDFLKYGSTQRLHCDVVFEQRLERSEDVGHELMRWEETWETVMAYQR